MPAGDHIIFQDSQQKKKNKVQSVEGKMLKERGSLEGKMVHAKPLEGIKKVCSSSIQGGFSRRRVDESSAVRPGSVHCEHEKTHKVDLTASRINTVLTLDADTKKRIFELIKDASSSLTLDQVKEMYQSPSTHTQYSIFFVDNITLGKVEGSVQSLRAALEKLEGSGSIQDAKMVCGNDLLNQILRWKDKIKVYLSPFLHGMHYTSFGRHFTKIEKLKEVVDMLHWYFQDGDILVDFGCGSNDFSCLMAKKLDEMGRRCSFKNYDLQLPKHNFCFEQRDWMSLTPDELPDGSQLIMGLNPPFGLRAVLANKFINKALEFKPKLLILIVPRETERLDKKEFPYDLIWEDDQMCTGKSFYLPGSVDIHDNQLEDWNVNPPVLYIWSHPSCTSRYKAIAEKHGHPFGGQRLGGKRKRKKRSNYGMSPQYLSATKRPKSRHLSPNVARTHSPLQVHSGRHQPFDQMNLPAYHYQPHADSIDDLIMRYRMSGGRPQQAYDQRSPRFDYGFRGSADNNISLPYNNRASYTGEMNEIYNPWDQRPHHPQSYQGPGFQLSPFRQVNSAANLNIHDEISAMQRYDPGLPLPPLMHHASGIYHARNPRPPPPFGVRPLGFASSAYRLYSPVNSSGWLNE